MKLRIALLAILPDRLILGPSTLGPLGSLPAPGTFGSLAGLLFVVAAFSRIPAAVAILLASLLAAIAIPLCGEAENRLGKRDPSSVILDEFVAMPFVFLGIFPLAAGQPGWKLLLAGFCLFAFFDILKPLGISRLPNLEGGLGIVADDIAAALASCLCLHLLIHFKLLP